MGHIGRHVCQLNDHGTLGRETNHLPLVPAEHGISCILFPRAYSPSVSLYLSLCLYHVSIVSLPLSSIDNLSIYHIYLSIPIYLSNPPHIILSLLIPAFLRFMQSVPRDRLHGAPYTFDCRECVEMTDGPRGLWNMAHYQGNHCIPGVLGLFISTCLLSLFSDCAWPRATILRLCPRW